jgi:hypothetical protein
VFDPLAITLVIATNQAFDRIKPKMNIYGEPKTIEPEPIVELEPVIDPNVELERQIILDEINSTQSSTVSGKRKGAIIQNLYSKLSSLSDDNTKTY